MNAPNWKPWLVYTVLIVGTKIFIGFEETMIAVAVWILAKMDSHNA